MTNPGVLYLTDDYDATELWIADLLKFDGMYPLLLRPRASFSVSAAARFDLIIIEIESSSRLDARHFCHRLRAITTNPILVISLLNDQNFALSLYEVMIDEYIVRPTSVQLLQAKIMAWQRWIVPTNRVGPH